MPKDYDFAQFQYDRQEPPDPFEQEEPIDLTPEDEESEDNDGNEKRS